MRLVAQTYLIRPLFKEKRITLFWIELKLTYKHRS